jgi:hippurate hydrolase
MKTSLTILCLMTTGFLFAQSLSKRIDQSVNQDQQSLFNIYRKLHANPELSRQEINTAAFLKHEIKSLGFDIVDSLGYHSFAGVLKNGNGPVIYYRTDMDGLPVLEKTRLEFASSIKAIYNRDSVSVMHACGHDIHMSTWIGIAQTLTRMRSLWKGTLVLLAQSAEETGQGAFQILSSKNYQDLPKPTIQLAMHDHAELDAGSVGFCDGYAMASVDLLNIKFFGKGGHGAMPSQAIDPILLSAQYIQAIQSIISRNLNPNDPAVITVGSIHGGTVGNIIPDEVEIKLTIRTFRPETRAYIFERLKTIANHLALSAGLHENKLPAFTELIQNVPAVYNSPSLGKSIRHSIEKNIPAVAMSDVAPVMIGEDFGVYGTTNDKIPSYLLWIGARSSKFKNETFTPSLHSPLFAPDYEKTIPMAVKVFSNTMIDLFNQNTK